MHKIFSNLQAEVLAATALEQIDTRYGRGFPSTNEPRLAYHNGYHTRCVIEDFNRLALAQEAGKLERIIGKISCASHDIEQGLGRIQDESASAAWLEQELRNHVGITESMIEMSRLAIMGTIPQFEGGLMVSQQASTQEYPSAQAELIAKMVASADLGRLYTPDGPYLAHSLFKEISGGNTDLGSLLKFQQNQVPFLEQYHYPLPEAIGVFALQKSAVVNYADQLAHDLEAGTIESWDEVMAKDMEFMKAN